jgi:hypothetical protein
MESDLEQARAVKALFDGAKGGATGISEFTVANYDAVCSGYGADEYAKGLKYPRTIND